MTNSKKDFEIVFKLINETINNLSINEFENLINGSATLKYIEKGIPSSIKNIYERIIKDLISSNSLENSIDIIRSHEALNTKTKLVEFCKYVNLETKTKDTIDLLIMRIVQYINENKDNILYSINKKSELYDNIDIIATTLEGFMDSQQAMEYLKSCEIISSKSNLLKLAKKLNVFISNEPSYEEILHTIVESVVGAKIRSLSIRKKI